MKKQRSKPGRPSRNLPKAALNKRQPPKPSVPQEPELCVRLRSLDSGATKLIEVPDHVDRNDIARAFSRANEKPRHLDRFVYVFDGSRLFDDRDVRYMKGRVRRAGDWWFYRSMFDDPWYLSGDGFFDLVTDSICDLHPAEERGLVKGIRIDAALGRYGFDLSLLQHVRERYASTMPTSAEMDRARRMHTRRGEALDVAFREAVDNALRTRDEWERKRAERIRAQKEARTSRARRAPASVEGSAQ